MEYLAWIIFIFTILQLMVALVNLIYQPKSHAFRKMTLFPSWFPHATKKGTSCR
jgi:hypothetical protein